MSAPRRGKAPSQKGEGARRSYHLRWSKRAEADLEDIYQYIAADDPVAAARWVEKLMDRARKVAPLPHSGRVVPEFGVPELREVLVRTYRIVYRIREHEMQVITVFEGHRLFPGDVDVEGDPGKR
jgi:toxin ParE1/3/4